MLISSVIDFIFKNRGVPLNAEIIYTSFLAKIYANFFKI